MLSVDAMGVGGVEDPPVLAVRARATIVVGTVAASVGKRSP